MYIKPWQRLSFQHHCVSWSCKTIGTILTEQNVQKCWCGVVTFLWKMPILCTHTLTTIQQLRKGTSQGCSYHVLCAHSLQGVVSLGSLTTQHDAVVAVQHGIGDVTGLSTSRARFLGHALKHLRKINKTLRYTFLFKMFSTKESSFWGHRPEWHRWWVCQSWCTCQSSFSGRWRPSLLGFQCPGLHGQPWCHH